jgi:TatD DNase family protein
LNNPAVPLVDTHVHLDFDAYDPDRDAVLQRAEAVGVTRLIIPGIDHATSQNAVRLSHAHAGRVYAAVGVHPNSTADFSEADLAWMRALAAERGVVSIGEIGLDYYWDRSPKAKQAEAFERQLALAAELGLPVILHNREASDDLIPIIERWAAGLSGALAQRPGVLHSVSAPFALAMRAVEAGFYLGFTGPITYKNADETRRIAAAAPLERIVVETDGPYLTPTPHRGQRNEPAYIPLMVERLAALRGLTTEAMGEATTRNAERLFGL